MRKATNRSKNGVFITKEQAEERYNLGRDRMMDLARESGSIIHYGRRVLIDTVRCDEYLRREYSE